jgi:hypothetical protein
MEYLKLTLGILLSVAFVFLFIRNLGRKGLIHSLFRIDTVVGIVAGGYLIITAMITLLA